MTRPTYDYRTSRAELAMDGALALFGLACVGVWLLALLAHQHGWF